MERKEQTTVQATLQTGLLSSMVVAAGLTGCGPGTALGLGKERSLLLSFRWAASSCLELRVTRPSVKHKFT